MPQNEISILLSAVNTASPELLRLQNQIDETSKSVQESAKVVSQAGAGGMRAFAKETEGTTRTLHEVLGPMKLFAGGLASELNPALGNIVFTSAAAGRALSALPVPMAAVGVALAAATALAITWIGALDKSLESTVKLQHQVNTLDFSGIVADLDDLAGRMEKIAEAERRGFLQGALEKAKEFQSVMGLTPKLLDQSLEKMQALEQLSGFRMREIAATGGLRTLAPLQQSQQLEQARALATADEERFIRAQQASTHLLQEQIALERDLVELRADAALGKERLSGVERSAILAERAQGRGAIAARERFGFAAIAESNRAGLQSIETRTTIGPDTYTGSEEDAAIKGGVEFTKQSNDRIAANTAARVAAEAQARTQLVLLSREQRLELTLTAIEQEKLLGYAQAKGKTDEGQLQAMAGMQAAMKRQIELQRDAAQTNPFVGLTLGIQEVVDEFTSAGDLMRSGVHQLGGDMASSFRSAFTDSVTGQFKKLLDLPKLLGQSMLNAMADVASKAVVGNLFSPFLKAMGGNASGFFADVGGGGGGGGVTVIGGQLYQQVDMAGGNAGLVPVGAVTGAGAASGVSGASVSSILGSIWNMPLASLFSGAGGLAAGGQVAEEAAALGIGGAYGGTAGATVGAALGVGVAALALGYTIYAGLKGQPGGPTTTSVLSGAASGAISGALLGSYFGPYGTVIGAVAGGLAGGGAAALGKDTTPRSVAETRGATDAAQAMIDNIASATTPEELFATLTYWNSGSVGGQSPRAIVTQVTGVEGVGPGTGSAGAPFIGLPNPTYRVATVAEMLAHPNDITASIQAGVAPGGLEQGNAAVVGAIRNKLAEFARFASIEVSQTADLGGGLSLRTTVPGSLASRLSGAVNLGGAGVAALSDDDYVALLKELRRVDADRSLNIWTRDPDTLQIVSVTSA
jgi:hypothetical protein